MKRFVRHARDPSQILALIPNIWEVLIYPFEYNFSFSALGTLSHLTIVLDTPDSILKIKLCFALKPYGYLVLTRQAILPITAV